MVLAANPRSSLDGQRFHVVVIGGGINGVAVARQCARMGKHTLLIEQNDFSSGVTSRSTRIIHGGLRYLEHGEIGLVRESLRERERLLREKSHLVHPMHFLLLLNESSQRSAMKLRAGLWLYQRMAGKPANTDVTEMELKRLERALDAGHRWSFFNYEDAQCEFPERLVAEWLLEAVDAGAVVRNHTEALAVNVAHGRVHGVLLRDQITGRDERVDASWVINCSGPWADRVCQRSSVRMAKPMLGGVRGSHIVLPRFPGSPSTAVYTEAVDGRPIFILPWNDQILLGTTEIADSNDPAKTVPSVEEIDYLIRSAAALFPKAKISALSVKHAFAGVRPLPYSPGNKPSAVTRRHILHDHADDGAARMISVIGGKLTTAASLARECARKIGLTAKEPNEMVMGTARAIDPLLDDAVLEIARIGSVSEESARGMIEWHGKRAADIARMALVSPELRAPICPHTSHVIAEVVEAYRREFAVTLGDVLLRRVPVALGACWSESCSREAALRIGAVMGWNDQTMGANLEGFEMERSAFLRPVKQTEATLEAAAD
ncbi:MAG TPA: glycerol-3-phosphate dehydrogenase/oxidase [Candidatus Aquilonibacter sp.]|jgi:glycerol-3-phosphate dehydrogenase|nr:glycerol-3-phosphate dehydrogenase/oxidase [Candidatus Aquilonibacter sp.]